jgi:4-amino-4-deoxy-L-arabinose transferase-like glycosyltransferase
MHSFNFQEIQKNFYILFILSFFIRIFFFIIYPDQLFPDSLQYEKLGIEFFNNNFQFTSPVHMPLYPVMSYIFGGRINLIFLDIILSSFSVILIFYLSSLIFDLRTGKIAGYISAIYPFFIFYSLSGLTETMYIFVQLSYIILLYKKKYLLSFFLIAVSLYLRPTLDLFYPLIIFSFIYIVHRERFLKTFKILLSYMLIYIIFLSPWWIHNYNKYDNFVRMNLAMGRVTYVGNNDLNKSGGGIAGIDVDLSYADKIENDYERYEFFLKETKDFIFKNPSRFLKLSAKRFIRFWRPYPYTSHYNSFIYNAVSIISFLPILIFSIMSLFIIKFEKFKKLVPIFIIIMSLTIVHTLTISSIRYRLPLEPFLIIFASYFISNIPKKK